MIVTIPIEQAFLEGDLVAPEGSDCIVIFAHGSGSSRHSPRNKYVAQVLNDAGFATLLLDLLTVEEERIDQRTAHLRFAVALLAERLAIATDWVSGFHHVGYFGASTGAAAALIAAARKPQAVEAVVSRGGRPDLAGPSIAAVRAPTLFIVGEHDDVVIDLNRRAARQMQTLPAIRIVPGASHLFEERGALEKAAALARAWFRQHLMRERNVLDSAS